MVLQPDSSGSEGSTSHKGGNNASVSQPGSSGSEGSTSNVNNNMQFVVLS